MSVLAVRRTGTVRDCYREQADINPWSFRNNVVDSREEEAATCYCRSEFDCRKVQHSGPVSRVACWSGNECAVQAFEHYSCAGADDASREGRVSSLENCIVCRDLDVKPVQIVGTCDLHLDH